MGRYNAGIPGGHAGTVPALGISESIRGGRLDMFIRDLKETAVRNDAQDVLKRILRGDIAEYTGKAFNVEPGGSEWKEMIEYCVDLMGQGV